MRSRWDHLARIPAILAAATVATAQEPEMPRLLPPEEIAAPARAEPRAREGAEPPGPPGIRILPPSPISGSGVLPPLTAPPATRGPGPASTGPHLVRPLPVENEAVGSLPPLPSPAQARARARVPTIRGREPSTSTPERSRTPRAPISPTTTARDREDRPEPVRESLRTEPPGRRGLLGGLFGRVLGLREPPPARIENTPSPRLPAPTSEAGGSRSEGPADDPAAASALKRQLHRMIVASLGDRLRSLEVLIQGRRIHIRAEAAQFWHRWAI